MASNTCSQDYLKDLLDNYQMTKEDLKQTLNDKIVAHIATQITDWELLAPFLGLSQSDQDNIKHNETVTELRKNKLLQKWIQLQGFRATALFLTQCFIDAGRKDLADKVCVLYKQKGPNHQPPPPVNQNQPSPLPVNSYPQPPPLANPDHQLPPPVNPDHQPPPPVNPDHQPPPPANRNQPSPLPVNSYQVTPAYNAPDPPTNVPDLHVQAKTQESSHICRHVMVVSGLCALLCFSIVVAGIATAEKVFKLHLPPAGDSGVVISKDSIVFVEKFDPFSVEEVKFKAINDTYFYAKRCQDISFHGQTVEQSRSLNVTTNNSYAISQYYLIEGSKLNYQIRLELNNTQAPATSDLTKCLAELKVFNTMAEYCIFLSGHQTMTGTTNTKCLTSKVSHYTFTAVKEPKYYFTVLYIPDSSAIMSMEYNISGYIQTYNVSKDPPICTTKLGPYSECSVPFEKKGTHDPSNDMCVLARASRDKQDTCEKQDSVFYEAEVRGESRKLYYSLHVGSTIFAIICIILMLTSFIAIYTVLCVSVHN